MLRAAAALSDRVVVVPATGQVRHFVKQIAAARATHAVVTRDDQIVSVVSLSSLGLISPRTRFGDLNGPGVVPSVDRDTSLHEVGRLLLIHETDVVSVYGADATFQGIVTERSLAQALLAAVDDQSAETEVLGMKYDELERLSVQRATDLRRANRIMQAEIGERINAEAALQTSEALLRSIIYNVPLVIARLNLDGTIAFFNRNVPGLPTGQIVGRHVADFVAVERREAIQAILAATISTGQTQAGESEWIAPNGTAASYSWRVAPVREGSRIVGIIAVATDTTETRRVAAQIESYADIVENIRLGLNVYRVEATADGHKIWCVSGNPAAERMTGVTARDLVGRTIGEVYPELRKTGLLEKALMVHNTRAPVEIVDFWYGDSRVPHGFWNFTIFPLPNDCVGIAFQNVTERRRAADALRTSEALNRLMLEAVPAGIVQVAQDGAIVASNAEAQRFLGLADREPSANEGVSLELETCYEDGSLCPVAGYPAARCLATGQPQPQVTLGVRRPGKPVQWAMFTAVPLINPASGECSGAVVTFLDITDRKRTEEHAREMQNQLAHVSRLSTMGEMASGLAHELNQPLAAIVAYADACRELVESGRMAENQLLEVLRAVSSQADRAGKIIHRMRNMIKKSEPVRARIQINDAVREVAGLLEPEVRSKGASLRLEFSEQLPDIWADVVLIQQVLLNLMRNGLDAMIGTDLAARELTVFTRRVADGSVEVAVRDRGRGIDRDDADRLFEPFFTTKAEGLGMGLSISRTIIEAHGGRLWFAANPEGGVTVRFVLMTSDQGSAA